VSFSFKRTYSNHFKSLNLICSQHDSAALPVSELDRVRLARQAFARQVGAS